MIDCNFLHRYGKIYLVPNWNVFVGVEKIEHSFVIYLKYKRESVKI